MIQRLQTVYFIAIIIIAAVSCSGQLITSHQMLPGLVKDYTLNSIYFNIYENGSLVSSQIQYMLILLTSVLIGWTINIILTYKNRVKQIRYTKINFAIIAVYILGLFTRAFMLIPDFNFGGLSLKSTFGVALLIFMLYLNMRALMLIKKDEDLVRSVDRLR
jgi:hypothetical protein